MPQLSTNAYREGNGIRMQGPWESADHSFHLSLVGERRDDFASYPYYRFAIAVGSGLSAGVFGGEYTSIYSSSTNFLDVVFLSRFLLIFLDFLFSFFPSSYFSYFDSLACHWTKPIDRFEVRESISQLTRTISPE